MSLEITLTCTCPPGWDVKGTGQEITQRLVADHFGLPVERVHLLLDLMDRALDEVMDRHDESDDRPENETATLMARRSGLKLGWVLEFIDVWQIHAEDVNSRNVVLTFDYYLGRRKGTTEHG